MIRIRLYLRILYSNLIRDSSEILFQMGERRGARGEEREERRRGEGGIVSEKRKGDVG